jgi:hypothetical protein
MPPHREIALFVAAGLIAIAPARAADRAVAMHSPALLAENREAFPVIANPVDDAERRINTALGRLEINLRKSAADCKDSDGKPGDWERSVRVPMQGPGFISFVIIDNTFCGGAHPDVGEMAIVYDLRTGAPVDWTHLLPPTLTGKVALAEQMDGTKMVTLASKRLYALFLAGYDSDHSQDAECKQAIKDAGADDPPAMMVWPDAKGGGLTIYFDLPHVVQACGEEVTIPLATLRAEGAQPVLTDAIAAAHGK